jgi:hypothetical protein
MTAPFTLSTYLNNQASSYQTAVNVGASNAVRAGATNPVLTPDAETMRRQRQEWIDSYLSNLNASYSGEPRGSSQPN